MSRYAITLLLILIIGLSMTPMNTPAIAQAKNCPGAPPSRLTVGGTGRVTFTPAGQTAIPVRVREAAGRTGKILGQLTDGTPFQVMDGPTCKDNFAWWKIATPTLTGWLAEGDDNGYFVEPEADQGSKQASDNGQPTATLPPTTGGAVTGTVRFAPFNPGKVDTAASAHPYQVAQDLSNVILSSALTQEQLDFIQRNGFVVSPGAELEFPTVYEKARYNYQPLFITTDSLLHSFHLLFDKVLRTAEAQYFIPLLRDMNTSLLLQADQNYQAVKGTDWEDAAKRTVAYIGVSAKLADAQANVPAYVSDVVNREIASINSAAGISPSVIFPDLSQGEDFTQYIPRGHYTKSDDLKTYFRAMMYYGRMTFRLSNAEETKSALLLALTLRDANAKGRRATEAWSDLYAATSFFVGESDDLTIPQYLQIIDKVYGANAAVKAVQGKGVDPFVTAAQALPSPRILGVVIQDTDDIDKETKGLRFMGQRFVWDAYVFRELIYRNVGTREKPRNLPMALDVFAAMGSERARQILDKAGATQFENFNQQLDKVRGEVGNISEEEWTRTLYNSWLYTLNALAQPVPASYPSFMTNQAYADRSLYGALGSFAELKHDTILYAKQAYAEMGGGGGKEPAPEPIVPPNYVEPVPLFWARLAALAEMTQDGLGKRNLLNPSDAATLKSIAELARRFQNFSVKELKNQPLTADEQNGLRFYGGDLEKILMATADDFDKDMGPGNQFADEPQAAVIADIATDPSKGVVLEIGVGRVFDMYAVVPVSGKLYLAHGAVFSYYEFQQPMANRLTDEAWQTMLTEGKAPAVPDWTFTFLSKSTVDSDLSAAVRNFQSYMVNQLWYNPTDSYNSLRQSKPQDGATKFLLSQLEPLSKAKQYEGRQIVETNFRSFDMQNDKTAVVTTRETWRGELHNNGPDEFTDGPKIAARGPYTIDVTYTLTKDENGQWSVTNVVVKGNLPAWNKTTG